MVRAMRATALLSSILFCACEGAPPTVLDAAMAEPDAGTPTAEPLPPAPSISIASWNLQTFPRDPGTIDAVRELVLAHELDLIGVQEITDPGAFEALAAALPEHEMVVSFDQWGDTRVGFLYRPARVRVGAVERLFPFDGWEYPRDPLMAEIAVLDAAGEVAFDFAFVVVHLKAQIDEESRTRRAAAVTMLDAWIRERTTIDPDVVVVGDYNDELTDPREQNVFLPLLDAPEIYRFLTLPAERAGATTYLWFDAMIDHVLITTSLLDEYGEGTTDVLRLDDAMPTYPELVSDHRPVVARFRP